MELPIDGFEEFVDTKILNRAYDYFNNGNIPEPEDIGAGNYKTIVKGSDDYEVELKIIDKKLINYSCTCPYDSGPFCKHVIGVLYYFRLFGLDAVERQFSINEDIPKLEKNKVVSKKNKINSILESITIEELKEFIRESTEVQEAFGDLFLTAFAFKNDDDTKAFYTGQIRNIRDRASGRDGYISWDQMPDMDAEVTALLLTAQNQIEKTHYQTAFYICFATIEELIDAFDYADDSDAYISGSIEFAFELLLQMSECELPEELRKRIYEECLIGFNTKKYKDWDWHMEFAGIASQLIKTDDEAERILKLLDEALINEYQKEQIQRIKLEIITKSKGSNYAASFMEENISNPAFRRTIVENLVNEGNFEKAEIILDEGIIYDQEKRPGLVTEWYNRKLKIAIITGDTENIIKLSKKLLIVDHSREEDYYALLKQHIGSDSWEIYIENLIKELKSKRQVNYNLICRLYIKEALWAELFEHVKLNKSLTYIEEYEAHLRPHYAIEIADMYVNEIYKHMQFCSKRSHYSNLCRYIRKIIKLGFKEKSAEIIANLKKDYPARKALLDELSRV